MLKKSFRSEIYSHILTIFDMELEIVRMSPMILKESLVLMDQWPITMYDAAFITCAQTRKAPPPDCRLQTPQKRDTPVNHPFPGMETVVIPTQIDILPVTNH
jgi:hypothetical protein